MSVGQDSKSGLPSGIFRPDATRRQKAMALIILGLLVTGLILLLYGRATGGTAASVAGLALFFGPLGAAIVHARIRARRDPVFAREVAETQAKFAPQQRARQNRMKLQVISAAAILAMLLMLGLLRSAIPALAHMSKTGFVILAQFLGGAAALALGLVWRLVKRKAAADSAKP
jgi:hypothetical protein